MSLFSSFPYSATRVQFGGGAAVATSPIRTLAFGGGVAGGDGSVSSPAAFGGGWDDRAATPAEQAPDIVCPGAYRGDAGFALLWDFVAGLPDHLARCRLVYGLFDRSNAHSEPQIAATTALDPASRCALLGAVRCGFCFCLAGWGLLLLLLPLFSIEDELGG